MPASNDPRNPLLPRGRPDGAPHDPLLSLPDKGGVLYVRLYQRMRALILEGSWPPGMRLPSSRTLAADLGIARNTASLAIDQLLADGWVETRSRSGTYVSASLPHRTKRPERSRESPPPAPCRSRSS